MAAQVAAWGVALAWVQEELHTGTGLLECVREDQGGRRLLVQVACWEPREGNLVVVFVHEGGLEQQEVSQVLGKVGNQLGRAPVGSALVEALSSSVVVVLAGTEHHRNPLWIHSVTSDLPLLKPLVRPNK